MLLGWCGPEGPGLVLGLFLAGLTGGALHCGPMCGPFVLGQTADRLAALPVVRMCEMARLRAGLLLAYHTGRMVTYAGLGALAGGLGGLPRMGKVAGVVLLGGALLFAMQALRRLVPKLPRMELAGMGLAGMGLAGIGVGRRLGRLTARLDRASVLGGVGRGMALGFLPCGLLYAALAVAGSAGGALAGAGAMAAFALGTVPVLAAIGVAGGAGGRWFQGFVARAAPVALLFNALILATAALNSFGVR